MFLRYPRFLYASVTLVMIAAYLVLTFLVREQVLESFNGVSVLPWALVNFLGGPTAGAAAFLASNRTKADENAISNTTPRSKLGIGLADFLVRYLSVTLVPFCVVYFGAVLTQAMIHHRGLLLLGLAPSALCFLASLVLIGEIIAFLVRLEILAVLAAFIVGTFLSLYSTNNASGVANWQTVNPAIFIFVAICLSITLVAKLAGDQLRFTAHASLSRLIQGMFLAVFFSVFSLLHPAPLLADRVAGPHDYVCSEVGTDALCVWKEGSYKVPYSSAMIERGHKLLDAAGGTVEPTLFIEPGLEKVLGNSGWNGRHIRELSTFGPSGDETQSWSSAQAIAGFFLFPFQRQDLQCGENDRYGWMLLDLTTNYIYGDIAFSDYGSSDSENDSAVAKIGRQWSGLSDDQIAHKIVPFIDQHRTTCTIKELQ